jgi:lipoprotein NlpD
MLRSVIVVWCSALVLTGCVTSSTHEAPIEERSQVGRPPEKVTPVAAAPVAPPPPVAREAHDGQYVVQAGDTLYSIALVFGQDFRDIARWNGLDDQAHLQIGQSLRVAPPAGEESSSAEATPIAVSPSPKVETRPLAPSDLITAPSAAEAAPAPGSTDQTAAMPAPAAVAPTTDNKAAAGEPDSQWAWPSRGKVLDRFDEAHNKGIDIGGNVGDPVYAANDGQVVYSGNSLPAYGKLVIIKHTDDYVSVYAHNNEILVTQGQAVKRGQRIADLGMTDASSPRLHFEIRRRGTPVDPLAYLPPR